MIIWIWTAAFTAALLLYFRQRCIRFSFHGVKTLYPYPFFGNMARVAFNIDNIAKHMDSYYQAFPGEKFVGKYEFMKPVLIVHDLDLVKRITVKDFENFIDHRSFVSEDVEPLFARNLISLKGQEWKDMRSTLSPAFTSSKIKLMVPFMEEVGEQMIQALKKQIKESPTGSIDADCKDLTARYANDVIASCAFGLKVDSHTDRNNQFFQMGTNATSFTWRQMILFFVISASPALARKLKLTLFSNKTREFFIKLVMGTMKDREDRNIIRPDMIHLLMESKKGVLSHEDICSTDNEPHGRDAGFATVEESTVGKKNIHRDWADIDLVAQATLFFLAGFETVSTGMSFALHELALHPDIQDRLYQEIKESDRKHGGKLTYAAIQNMTYLDMVVSEVLRMWPPGLALDRYCVKNYNIGRPNDQVTNDYIIYEGEVVSIPVWCFHHDPKYFPDPETFDPERFSDDNKHFINPMAYLPFGSGPRNCIGSRFALCELKVFLYQILLNIEVSPSPKTRLPSRLATGTFRLKGGHWLTFKLRAEIC
ncbi:cytochrome P450 9e2-like isoform X2 [Maniola hyperantus]|uniref:cytochrome P450 9e2-like isoform X2 n=1 Tax=Aphantopus hyperantus TaxID=2795564 RepID=UPI001569A10B|nr:cytochrome P450 9e2-like isoform X2 [Maniola hyperantus]